MTFDAFPGLDSPGNSGTESRVVRNCKASIHVSATSHLSARLSVSRRNPLGLDCDDWREGIDAVVEKRPPNFGTSLKGNE